MLSLIDDKSKFDKTTRICHFVKSINSTFGAYTYVAPKTQVLDAKIGKFCSIASDCKIGLASHSLNFISTSPIFTSKNNATKYSWVNKNSFNEIDRVSIGNDVWIGIGAKIMGGITIGNGAVIGAGAIVTKDVPSYSIVGGIPAKILKYRFNEDVITFLSDINWWDLPTKELKNHLELFEKKSFSLRDLKKLN
jgi:acetyltransferase-like isoleucine patch superfamily enzyme